MAEPTLQSGTRCYRCGSTNAKKHGFSKTKRKTKQRFFCHDCGRGFRENPAFIQGMTERKGGSERKNLPSARRLILELREIAQYVLGRTPGVKDIKELSRQKRSYSLDTYLDVFGGSFREAIRQAGLTPAYPRRPDPEKMLEELRTLRTRLNRPLSRNDVVAAWKEWKAPSLWFISREFGTLTKALEAAGAGRKKYSREEMIDFLRTLDARIEGPVETRYIDESFRRGEGPSCKSIRREFGSLKTARAAAGITNGIYGRTTTDLIAQLHVLEKTIGRKPMGADIIQASKRRLCASINTFVRTFGSLREAYRAAGYVESRELRVKPLVKRKTRRIVRPERPSASKRPSEGDLILKLCALAQALGRRPTASDVSEQSKKGRGASLEVYRAVFGRFTTALERARLISRDEPEIDEQTLIRELRALRKKLNRPVLTTDIIEAAKKGRMSSVYQFKRAFGTLKNTLKVAGVGKSFNREEIIKYLRKLDSTLDRPIHPSDITRLYRAGKGPSLKVIYNAFGGLKKARRAAGTQKVYLTKRKGWSHGPKYTPKELIAQLKRLAKRLGRKPSKIDFFRAGRNEIASYLTFAKSFGSIGEAYRAAGFFEVSKSARRYTDEEILAAIEKLSKEFGRMPKYGEFESASRKGICPDPGTIARRLGPLADLKSRFA